MKIAEGLQILEVPMDETGQAIMNLVLVWDENSAVLIDTGIPGKLETIRNKVEEAGVPFGKLNMILITHQDMDHVGSLSDLQKSSEKIKVYSHDAEKPYIELTTKPIKMTPERFAQMGPGPKVDHTVQDGELLNVIGGIRVIHTPGHTPGHICLYLNKYKTLVTGDALNAANGRLLGPNPQYTQYMDQALDSLKKLLQYDIQTVICYHGGIVSGDVHSSLEEILRESNT